MGLVKLNSHFQLLRRNKPPPFGHIGSRRRQGERRTENRYVIRVCKITLIPLYSTHSRFTVYLFEFSYFRIFFCLSIFSNILLFNFWDFFWSKQQRNLRNRENFNVNFARSCEGVNHDYIRFFNSSTSGR